MGGAGDGRSRSEMKGDKDNKDTPKRSDDESAMDLDKQMAVGRLQIKKTNVR